MIPAQRTHNAEPPYTPATLAAAIAGDRDAFAELWRAHHSEVRGFVGRRVPDRALAEDLTSETFARALRRIGTFDKPIGGGMGAWLITIARNLIFDHAKSSRHQREVVVGEMYDAEQLFSSHAVEGPEDDVLTRLQNAAVREAIKRLNDQQRECVELRFLRGLSVAETAQELGRNEGAIKTLQYRAVRTLGRLIATDPALADAGAR